MNNVLDQMVKDAERAVKAMEAHGVQAKTADEYFNQLIKESPEEYKQQIIDAKNNMNRVLNLAQRGDGSHLPAIQNLINKYASKNNR